MQTMINNKGQGEVLLDREPNVVEQETFPNLIDAWNISL